MAKFTKEDADRYIKEQVQDYARNNLQIAKDRKSFICPVCGKGAHGDGLKYDETKNKYSCFGACATEAKAECATFDTCDLIRAVEHTDDRGAYKRALELYGIEIVKSYGEGERPVQTVKKDDVKKAEIQKTAQQADEKIKAEIAKYKANAKGGIPYLTGRGISADVQERFNIGFCKEKNAVIIPTSETSFVARRIDKCEEGDRYRDRGSKHFFNIECLTDESNTMFPIFVVEGEIDALSFIEKGQSAIGLGSMGQIGAFVKYCQENKPVAPLIIALDNDYKQSEEKGKRTEDLQHNAVKQLREAGIEAYEIEKIYADYKDANEFLQSDEKGFTEAIGTACRYVFTEKGKRVEEYIKNNSASGQLYEIKKRLSPDFEEPAIPTGFEALDTVLDGGLYAGLYSMGAVSSLGKTTFALQVADNIARAGQDVLFFSLEMSRAELMARSISRESAKAIAEAGKEQGIPASYAMSYNENCGYSTRTILKGGYSHSSRKDIQQAISSYENYSDHIFIIEGMGNISVIEVAKAIKKHIAYTGKTPVVFIDYLQIIAPTTDKTATDKQIMDKAILELKRISRDYKTPVVVVSSVSRAFYNEPITLEAFKESGAIEYGSDVVMGLQIAGIEDIKGKDKARKVKEFTEKAYSETPRKVELKILKNRNGSTKQTVEFKFFPVYNTYYCGQVRVKKKDDDVPAGYVEVTEEKPQSAKKAERKKPNFDGQQKRIIEKAEEGSTL